MKNVLLMTLTTAAILIIAGCEQFTTSYQRIDDGEFRMLDFIYEPADASPGDTVTLTAIFAGKKTVDLLGDIDWGISFNVMRDLLFGSVTVVDSMPLNAAAESFDTVFSPKTRAVKFRIPIPKDIMLTSKQIPDQWTDALPDQLISAMPPEFVSMTKKQIIDTLEWFLENIAGAANGGGGGDDNPLIQNTGDLPKLLQFFTVPIRVTAKMSEAGRLPHTIRSYQTIRYNRRLRAAGVNVPVNRNPVVDSIVVYKVEGKNITNFDNKNAGNRQYTSVRLDKSKDPVILAEDGYTYFLEAFSGSSVDRSITMGGKDTLEAHYAYWQFQLDPAEAGSVHFSRYMDTGGGMGGSLSILTPPTDRGITKFTLWVTVKDEFLNEMNRPEASTLAEVSGRFEYK